MTIKAEDLVFQRGANAELIPQEVTLELEGNPIVKVIPLTRGRLQEVYAKAMSKDPNEKIQSDTMVLKSGLVEPKLTDEQLEDLKPQYSTAIILAIMSVSLGVSQKEVKKSAENLLSEQDEELKKK